MFQVRKAQERGHFNHGWLDTYHTFSFGEYYDQNYEQFRALRVMNEDVVAPATGFGMHGHRDMEILTFILSGSLEHRDSLGNGSALTPGKVQRMSAGSGIRHSEANPSKTEPVHLYQIWLLPAERGITPSYEEQVFSQEGRRNRWQLVASPDRAEGSMTIHQDAKVYQAELEKDAELSREIPAGRHAWLQVMQGSVEVNGVNLKAGDGVAVSEESRLTVKAEESAAVLLFDLA